MIARDGYATTLFGDGCHAVERSIAVDDQARVAAQHQGCIEMRREAARHVGSTRIPGDMIGEPGWVEPKGAESSRDPVGGVIADEYRATGSGGIDYLDRGRFIGLQQR
jgi:hypothetical protein